jgi:hypothetical protein
MKLTTITQVSVDGVVQANGGRNEKFDPGMDRGGWARPLFDNEAMTFVNQVYRPDGRPQYATSTPDRARDSGAVVSESRS